MGNDYSDFYDQAPDLLFSIEPDTGQILDCNYTACRELGYEKSELIGHPILKIHMPSSCALALETLRTLSRTGFVRNVELQLRRKDGSPLDIYLSASAVRKGKKVVRSRSICRVITDIKAARSFLQSSETEARARAQELQAILDAVPAMIFIAHDPECTTMTSSRSAYELLRLPFGANSSKSAPQGLRPTNFRTLREGQEISAANLPVQQAAISGEEVRNAELTIAFDDGTHRQIFGHAVPLLDESKRVRGAVGAFIDVTEQKRLERLELTERAQRENLQRDILTREGERRRLARELHDEAGQTLASLLAGLGALKSAKSLNQAKRRARDLRRATKHGIDEIARISQGLHPLVLEDFGLRVALQNLVKDYAKVQNSNLSAKVAGFTSHRLPRIVEITVYRIAQESLNNAMKHANAKSIQLILDASADGLKLKVIDDGRGFRPAEVPAWSRGRGLRNMAQRAEMIGGNFNVHSGKAGTTVCLDLIFSNDRLRGKNWAAFEEDYDRHR